MSSSQPWMHICSSENSTTILPNNYFVNESASAISPIDDLVAYFRDVMRLGSVEQLDSSNVLGRVLLLGLVSGTETYFRTLLARLVSLCPVASEHAGSQMMSFASVNHYGMDNLGFALLERASFSSPGELIKTTAKLAGIKIDNNSSAQAAIEQFEILCHFRHAAVHARGELNAANLVGIGVKSAGVPSHLVVRFNQLHDAAQICMNAARAYNRHVYKNVVSRWISKRQVTGNWNVDKKNFTKLINLFRCREDGFSGRRHVFWLYSELISTLSRARCRGRDEVAS